MTLNLVPRAFSSTIFKMADRREKTIRHFENRRGEGPGDEVAMTLSQSWLRAVAWHGAVVSWLVRSSPDGAVRVRALARATVLCINGYRQIVGETKQIAGE